MIDFNKLALIDLHCDTISKLIEDSKDSELYHNNFCIDINKLTHAGAIAQFFALYIDLKFTLDPFEKCLSMIEKFNYEIIKNVEFISHARDYEDFEANLKNNRISAFLTIEEGAALNGKIENLKLFYDLGVRLITLSWNYPNELGFPNFEKKYINCGLTLFGIEVVREMNNLGMLIDVSHLSDKGFYDVSEISSKPFVASHSNSRSITNHPRNLTDDMIKLLAEKGGIIGVNFEPSFLGSSSISKIADMVSHIKYMKKIGGIDVIAIGSDFDGTTGNCEIQDIGQMSKLRTALKDSLFTDEEIEKIFYKNALRVMKDVL